MIRIDSLSYGPAPWEMLPGLLRAKVEGEIMVSEDGKTAVVRVTKISQNPPGESYSELELEQLALAVSHTWDIVDTGYEGHSFHLRHGEQDRPALSIHLPRL